jgi:hypothetical protein
MYTMFLNLPLSWYTLHALLGCCRRARLTGILLCYLFLLPGSNGQDRRSGSKNQDEVHGEEAKG